MLLLNGASGIAVGMATNCPPHNLGEVVDALTALLAEPELSDDELFRLLPAPDFPTGGEILGLHGARDLYTTGRGSIMIRARAHMETLSRGGGAAREAIVVTELPYATQKNGLLEKVARLASFATHMHRVWMCRSSRVHAQGVEVQVVPCACTQVASSF